MTKLLSINIKDIRINKDINKKLSTDKILTKKKKTILDFRDKKVPPSIITFAQFIAVHVHNISVVLMNNDFDPGWMLHATASELHLDGSIVQNAKSLMVTAALNDAHIKILRQSNENKTDRNQPSLIELSFGIALDGVLFAHGPLSLEKLHLSMNNTKMILHGGLYDFIKDAKKAYKVKDKIKVLPGPEKDFTEICDSNIYERFSPILPKNFLLTIEDTTISAVRENSSNDFSAKLENLSINGKFNKTMTLKDFNMPTLYTGFQIQNLEIDTKHEKLLYIEQLSMDSKLEEDTLNIYTKLKTFQLIYNHSDIYAWISNNLLITGSGISSKQLNFDEKIKISDEKENLLKIFLKQIVIKGCAELWNISTLLKFPNQTASLSVSHTKFLLEQFSEIRSSVYENRLVNLLLENRHWSTELMIESLWWSLGSTFRDSNSLKKNHSKGSPLYLGVSLIKLSSYGNATKLDFSVHTIRTEYSYQLAEFIIQGVLCLKQYNSHKSEINKKVLKLEVNPVKKKSQNDGILINAKITDVTFFFFNKYNTCLLASLSEVSLARTHLITVLKFDGLQMATLEKITKTSAISLSDFTEIFLNIKLIRVEYTQKSNEHQITANLYDNTNAMWNPNLHMHFVTLIQDMSDFKKQIKPNENHLEIEKPEKKKLNLMFDLFAEGSTIFAIKISERHSVEIYLENIYLNKKDRIFISMEHIRVHIDDQHIVELDDLISESMSKHDVLTIERENYEHFVLPTNKVWATTIGCFKMIFPYNHDFSEAIQNEFVSTFKWLKLVHNIKKKVFTKDSPLPSDMIIRVSFFFI